VGSEVCSGIVALRLPEKIFIWRRPRWRPRRRLTRCRRPRPTTRFGVRQGLSIFEILNCPYVLQIPIWNQQTIG
jgi:hypothetical protein